MERLKWFIIGFLVAIALICVYIYVAGDIITWQECLEQCAEIYAE